MPTQLQFRRGTTDENDAFTGAAGELTFDNELNQIRVHDGSTQGGFTFGSVESGLSGDITIGTTGNNTVKFISEIVSNLVPSANVTYDLGTSEKSWRDLYLSGNSIFLGDDLTLRNDGGTLKIVDASNTEVGLSPTGTATGTFGNSSIVPVITVGADGRITSISNTSVAGVSSVDYYGANSTLRISTADGSEFDTTISTNDKMEVANTRALFSSASSNSMSVANTRALYTTLQSNTLSTSNATTLFNDRMQVANTRALIDNLSANVLSTANATLNTIVSTGNNTTLAISTGDLTAPTVTSNTQLVTDYIGFTPKPHPTHGEGRFFYDSVHNTFNFQNDISGINFELGTNEYVRVFNNSGATLTGGTPIAFNGLSDGIPIAAKADASSSSLYEFRGLATQDIANGTFGYITSTGVVREIDTSGLSVGSVFVDDVAGELTNIEPQYPNFPYCVGEVLLSSANGEIYVMPQNHSLPSLRVINNGRVDGDLTVAGNLNILGTESSVNIQNLEVSDTFVYLNGGDTIGEDNTNFTGTGLDDGIFTGHYEGTTTQTYYVRIDGVGTGAGGVDTFEWSLDNFSTTEATGVDITGADQALSDNININFESTTGHTSGDKWDGTGSPINVDVGIVSNRNTGASGVGYTHLGVFYDVSDNRFKFFDVYEPEPEGNIDTSNVSYRSADVVANTFFGTLVGSANTASALATSRNIAVTGIVSGNTNFDGTGDVTVTTTLNFGGDQVTTSAEGFANNDTTILTSAATTDKIIEMLPRIYDVNDTQVFP